jgi:hypothetical protein
MPIILIKFKRIYSMFKRKKNCKNLQRRMYKEILVENFEISNGILGLDRDCYLRFVKFLDSSILRKVCVNIFCFF